MECNNCKTMLDGAMANTGALHPCPSCGALTRLDVFSACFREEPSSGPAETLLEDKVAGCFYHPRKKAAVSCASCGRFLCSLCSVELEGKPICFSCLETGKKKKKIKNLENNRTLYDRIALSLALYPMLIFYFTFLTAPIVLFISIRYWNAPASLLPRTKIRFIAAMVIALLQIVGWVFGISQIVSSA